MASLDCFRKRTKALKMAQLFGNAPGRDMVGPTPVCDISRARMPVICGQRATFVTCAFLFVTSGFEIRQSDFPQLRREPITFGFLVLDESVGKHDTLIHGEPSFDLLAHAA